MNILLLCGIYNLGMALFHSTFWKIFHWNSNLKKLHFANRAIMQIFNVQMIYFFLFVAGVCFIFPEDLLNTTLGHGFLLGNAVFWLVRTIQQFFFLRVNRIFVHILTVIFLLGVFLFAWPVFMK